VAEEAKRPLISLTCSDIGTDPAQIERRLQFWFELAKSWGAILLLDDADVYMEQRTVSDLERNNLVASFLRKLEYYQGILFLATNRVGTFDEAFLSRIDIPIYYPDFTSAQREKIWNSFFWKLERERENELRVHRSARSLIKDDQVLLSLEWNAREIRNAFQTAVALAEVENKKGDDGLIAVTAEHIRKVVELSKGFKDYLKELYQKNEAERAAQRGIRYDQFGKDEVVSGKAPV
jgi:ATPase family associated with various cellular activities (AAA)